MEHQQQQFKLIVLGDGSVGKTTLLIRFCSNAKPKESEEILNEPFVNPWINPWINSLNNSNVPSTKPETQPVSRNKKFNKDKQLIPTRMKMPKRKNNRINQPR